MPGANSAAAKIPEIHLGQALPPKFKTQGAAAVVTQSAMQARGGETLRQALPPAM